MDPEYRGYGGYGSDEREEHHHHHHHHHSRPPPPPQEEQVCEEEGWPPPFPHFGHHPPEFPHLHKAPDPYAPPDPYTHAAHAHPYTHPPADPYTHAPSGPYTHPNPHASHLKEPSVSAYPSATPAAHELPEGQLVRVFCKANSAFNLAVEHNGVVMVPAKPEDETQQWIKDSSYSMRVKDNYGHPAFSLVNKKTRKVLKHAKEKGQQVLLMDYRPDIKDDDILWSESQDFGEGFKTVRSASDTLLNLTVFEGGKKIRNGSALVLDTWHKGDHQLWKNFILFHSYCTISMSRSDFVLGYNKESPQFPGRTRTG